MHGRSAGLQAELSYEQDRNRELCELMQTLEAELVVKTRRADSTEDELRCLRVEQADADADAASSLLKLAV